MPRLRTPLRRLAIAAIAIASFAGPADAFRVVTWNLLQYPTSNLAGRQPHFRTVMAAMDCDVMVVQELLSPAGADSFLTNVLQVALPARRWKHVGHFASAEGTIYYDSLTTTITNVSTIATSGPRDVLFGVIRPRGYNTNAAWFRAFSVHFKAGGPGTADSTTRRLEATDLRTSINNQVTTVVGPNFIVGGDYNLYGAEGAYVRLTESQLDNDGRGQDPYPSMPLNWHVVPSLAGTYSQCPCNSCAAPFSGGGLDDRFDLWLGSPSLFDGAGLDIVPGGLPGGYGSFGNDGNHYNDDVDGGGFNTQVGLAVASALRQAADHLPVIVTLQLPAKVAAQSQLAFGDVILGASPTLTLNVSNGATVPADELDYTLSAPAGFTASGGAFVANAGAGANAHSIGMLTATTGAKAGTLTVASDAPDTLSKSVLLSGRVLAHAVSSLDSLVGVTSDTLDFGAHESGAFANQDVRVHNRGWGALQARLSVGSAAIVGGAGRFTLVQAFSPVLLAGIGKTWSVQFDDAGTTADSTYEATLTFTCDDEALPGAQPAAPLVLTLLATRTAGSVDAPGGAPAALRFAPPRPNPARGGITFEFELPREAHATLGLYDLNGRRVATATDGELGAGRHSLRWIPQDAQARALPAGLYFARFQALGLTRVERVVLLP